MRCNQEQSPLRESCNLRVKKEKKNTTCIDLIDNTTKKLENLRYTPNWGRFHEKKNRTFEKTREKLFYSISHKTNAKIIVTWWCELIKPWIVYVIKIKIKKRKKKAMIRAQDPSLIISLASTLWTVSKDWYFWFERLNSFWLNF